MIVNSFLAVLIMIALGQANTQLPPDFATLQKLSVDELKLKTDAHRTVWGLDRPHRWDLNQDSGELVFSFPDGIKAVAQAQIIGTYNTDDHTWLWAWANPSIEDRLKADALTVRKYGEEHHVARLTQRKWTGTEDDAWAMAALAVKLCGEQGAYRGPAGPTKVFIAFGEVTLSKK
ncbi:MAG TPA: hypothetical protein VF397_06060 [Pyrinomonadaceae bacterium]